MKTFKVVITVYSLVGEEKRELLVKARNQMSAEKKAIQIMGSRSFHVHSVLPQ